MLFVMVDDFLNDEIQEFLGELGVELGFAGQRFEARNLRRLARGI